MPGVNALVVGVLRLLFLLWRGADMNFGSASSKYLRKVRLNSDCDHTKGSQRGIAMRLIGKDNGTK